MKVFLQVVRPLFPVQGSLSCVGAIVLAAVAAFSWSAGVFAADEAFPLKISPNGRFLVDQEDKPFFMHGDSPWSLIAQLDKKDTGRYLDMAARQGFNTLIVNITEHKFSDKAPKNNAGEPPFLAPGDFSTPNEAYFAHADWVLKKAADKGMLVLLFPAWAAHSGNNGGWNQETVKNGPEKCRGFGRYLGNRYKDYTNIIWGHGGDQRPSPDSPLAQNMLEILLGIRDAAPKQLHYYHGHRGYTSLDQANFAPHVDLDAVYSCDEACGAARAGEAHTTALKAYNRENFKPHFLFEAVYEYTRPGKPKWGSPYTSERARLRRQAYWAILCGGTGHVYGNYPVWALQPGWDGPEGLGSPGYRDMRHLKDFFTAYAWWKLVPDQTHAVVTAGYGTCGGADYVTTALADDGSLVMAYLPSTGTERRTLTVDMSKLAGRAVARWYNPAEGTYQSIDGSPLANAGKRKFTTPGDNGTGKNDWALVLEGEKH